MLRSSANLVLAAPKQSTAQKTSDPIDIRDAKRKARVYQIRARLFGPQLKEDRGGFSCFRAYLIHRRRALLPAPLIRQSSMRWTGLYARTRRPQSTQSISRRMRASSMLQETLSTMHRPRRHPHPARVSSGATHAGVDGPMISGAVGAVAAVAAVADANLPGSGQTHLSRVCTHSMLPRP